MPMVLLQLYHQYQQPVFIQPSITKGSAGRPLIDYFNWLVGGVTMAEKQFILISWEEI